jgi:hypothetical protein
LVNGIPTVFHHRCREGFAPRTQLPEKLANFRRLVIASRDTTSNLGPKVCFGDDRCDFARDEGLGAFVAASPLSVLDSGFQAVEKVGHASTFELILAPG